MFSLLTAIFAMCGYYLFYHERRMLTSATRLLTLLSAAVGTVALMGWASLDPWPVPL